MKGLGSSAIRNWIFVTGMPRSGTTFVGKVLSFPLAVDYLHEPFNPSCGIPGLDQRYLYLRAHLESEQARTYQAAAAALLRYEVRLKPGLYSQDSPLKRAAKRVVGSRGGLYLNLAKWNPFHKAAVIKDPTGLFLTAFLAHHFGVKPVIVVRHPVSLAASWQRLGWQPALQVLSRQEALMEDYLADERDLLTRAWRDPVEKIAVFWRVAHKVLLQQAAAHPGWHVVRHETLSATPQPSFRELYDALALPWSARIEKRLERLTRTDNPAEARPGKVQDFRRNSTALFRLRRDALPLPQRQRIFDLVADVAAPYYTRDSFALDEGAMTPQPDHQDPSQA